MKVLKIIKSEDGVALVFTIMVMLVILVTGTVILSISTSSYIRVKSNEVQKQARFIAESGVNKAFEWAKEQVASGVYSGFFLPETSEETVGSGTVKYSVSQNAHWRGENYRIVATAKIRPAESLLEAENVICADFKPELVDAFQFAVFSDSDLIISGNVHVNGKIWSNSNINKNGASGTIPGPVYAVGDVTGFPSGTQTSSNQLTPIDFPNVDFDYLKANKTSDNLSSLSSGDIVYLTGSSVTIGNINENVYIVAEGEVEINGSIGSSNCPVGLFAKEDITISGNYSIFGIIYTLGRVKVTEKPTVTGTIVTQKGLSGGTPDVSYDPGIIEKTWEPFGSLALGSHMAELGIVRWQEED